MIFLTVGTQEPFDRLVKTVDCWCADHPGTPVIGQVSDQARYQPRHFEVQPFMAPDRFRETVDSAQLIVSHAGMGSIIVALSHMRPILILPRKASLGEHRGDHQLATAARFADRPGVTVAQSEDAVPGLIDELLAEQSSPHESLPRFADQALLDTIRGFIHRR